MKKRVLGKTEMILSEIGFGCRSLGGAISINGKGTTFSDINEKAALELIRTALKLGINHFDTADNYSLGESEKRLGKSIKDIRSEVYIFTKGGAVVSGGNSPFEIDLSYNHLMAALNRSLERLQTNYVDLFQTHAAPKNKTEIEEIKKVFNEIKKNGKARYCGISVGNNFRAGVEILKENFVDAIQISFSLMNPKALIEILPLAKKYQVGIIVNRPLEEGFLINKIKNKKFNELDARKKYQKNILKRKIEIAEKFNSITNSKHQLNQIALAYVLNKKEITSCIPSSTTKNQIINNVDSIKIDISEYEKNILEIQEGFNLL
jgi:aryl-alcohol dehydrogenase-like predicted oxidoreductase